MKSLIKNFQQTRFAKSLIYFIVGIASYPGLAIINRLQISGTENLKNLPRKNVLFVSNHQTYFADHVSSYFLRCKMAKGK